MKSLFTTAVLIGLFGAPALAQPDIYGGYRTVSCNPVAANGTKLNGIRSTGRADCNAANIGQRWQDGYASEAYPTLNVDRDPDPATRLQLRRERASGFPSH
jgi:hypothetical protein